MPEKYTLGSLLCDSDYEDADGTHYSVVENLGRGRVVHARKMKSEKDDAVLVVLDPVDPCKINHEERQRKLRFFTEHYADFKPKLFTYADTNHYRMIVPFISGLTYLQLLLSNGGKIKDIEQQLKLFLSLIAELKALHSKGLVYLDLKLDNIIYDEQSGKSHLIDGGLAVKKDDEMPDEFSVRASDLNAWYKSSYHIAKECWFTDPSAPRPVADPRMDIYSLGTFLLGPLFDRDLDSDVSSLAFLCVEVNPQNRPTLDSLETGLRILLTKKIYRGYQSYARAILHEPSDMLYQIIQFVAERFLLAQKIRFSSKCSEQPGRSYLLKDQSAEEQQLYLELAGLTFFHYLSTNKLADLDLQCSDKFQLSLVNDILLIKSMVAPAADAGQARSAYPNIKCWKIDKKASALLFDSLVCKYPALQGFTYNIEEPVETAIQLRAYILHQTAMAEQVESDNNEQDIQWACLIA